MRVCIVRQLSHIIEDGKQWGTLPHAALHRNATDERLRVLIYRHIYIMDEGTSATPAPAGKNKKILWIVGGVAVVLLLVAIFGGVGGRGGSIGSAYLPGVNGADVDRNSDGTVTYNTGEGSVTVGSGAGMPSNWPSDAPPVYSGATIMYSGSTNPATGAAGSAVVYTTKASAQSILDYYNSRLKAEGWTIDASANMAGTNVIAAKKDTRTFAAYIQDAGDGTVSVTVGIEL
ncbi:MAG: hypothetical protein G01um10148_673 [Parcubacteria group bacterium Gr01-1014_8]|nr:MAG: hypothetical protein G01um10148_673 [Parcubacteria group bacterium Gr01-1014_8]